MVSLPAIVLAGVLASPVQGECECGDAAPPAEAHRGPFGSARVGFGAWRPAMEIQLQAGWDFGTLATGIAVEHNPFIDFNRPDMSAGAFCFGAFLAFHLALTHAVSLRFEVLTGGAVLLFDTYGYRAGEMGLWLGARAMGLDVAIGEHLVFMLDVADMTIPAFALSTLPFLYQQWRWSIGLAFR